MRFANVTKIALIAALAAFISLKTIGHPDYMNVFARDPRSKPEQRTNCTICHSPDGRATEAGFLTEFGRAFKQNGNRITSAMRDKFTDLFEPAQTPVKGLDPDTIKLETALVSLNVTVTDAQGKLVTSLDREAFTVLEDERQQEIVGMFAEDAPVALAVVIDLSGSALTEDLERWRNAVKDLAGMLRERDVMSVYTFGGEEVVVRKEFAGGKEGWNVDLKTLKPGGGSLLFDAVARAAGDIRKRSERRRAIFVFSDGSDSGSRTTLGEAEQLTFHSGAELYAIDIINTQRSARESPERQAAAQTLERLASNTGGRYVTAEGFYIWGNRAKLKRLLSDLINELHSQYTIIYEPGNLRRSGRFRSIRIQMEQSDLKARARLGYREAVR
jgi:Ca-activated chloride channel family protein